MGQNAAIVLLAAAAAGCGGPGVALEPVLPYHVAVIPTETKRNGNLPGGELDGDAPRLDVDEHAMSTALAEALRAGCFARVTLLDSPPDGASNKESEAFWLRSAEAEGADLIVTSTLEYWPDFESEMVLEKATYGTLVLLLAGPASYIVDDRMYQARVELVGSFRALRPGFPRESFASATRRLNTVRAQFDGATLDLVDRAGGDLARYVPTILFPPAFFSADSDQAAASLSAKIVDQVAANFRDRILLQQDDLLVADALGDFWFEPDESRIAASADGTYRLSGTVLLRMGGGADEIRRVRLFVGEDRIDVPLGAREVDEARSRRFQEAVVAFPIEATFRDDDGTGVARLQVEDESSERRMRTFTLRLHPPGEE